MPMPVGVVLTEVECCRCGHKWYPRKPGLPKTCAGCRSPYWNTPRQNETGRHPAKPHAGNSG